MSPSYSQINKVSVSHENEPRHVISNNVAF